MGVKRDSIIKESCVLVDQGYQVDRNRTRNRHEVGWHDCI